NLNEDGYLIASDEELLGVAPPAAPEVDAETAKKVLNEAQVLGLAEIATEPGAGGDDPSSPADVPDSVDESNIDLGKRVEPDYEETRQVEAPVEPRTEASFSSRAG